MRRLSIFRRLASQLQSIGERLFMGSDETSEILRAGTNRQYA